MICPYCSSENVVKRGRRNNRQRYKCNNCSSWFSFGYEQKYKDELQYLNDEVRINNKKERYENRLESISNKLFNYIKQHYQPITTPYIKYKPSEKTAIVQLSDIHFGESIDEPVNKYNYDVASARLYKYANKVKEILKPIKPKFVVLAFTGDMFNSDRRLDEIITNVDMRAKSFIVGFSLIQQFILDLSRSFNIKIASVMGNESRLIDEKLYSKNTTINNFDWLLHNLLQQSLNGVIFLNSCELECVLNINDYNVLLIHGDNLNHNKLDDNLQKVVGKYKLLNININYIIFGHVHSTNIGTFYARSGSLTGSNSYSHKRLNYYSRASQNIHILDDDGIDTIKIDLQNYDINKKYRTPK